MVLAGDYAGWCITTQCLDQAFQLSRSELRIGSFSISEAVVGDFSPIRYAFSLLLAAVLGNFFMWTTGIIARLLFTHFDASKSRLPASWPSAASYCRRPTRRGARRPRARPWHTC